MSRQWILQQAGGTVINRNVDRGGNTLHTLPGMVMKTMIRLMLPGVLLLAACATPDYRMPALDEDVTSRQQRALQEQAVTFQLARRARLYDLSWPLLVANTELCPKTRKSVGIVLADLEAYADYVSGLTAEQLKTLGVADDLHILHVMKDSPADQAGLRKGMFIRSVNGEALSGAKPEKIAKAIRKAGEEETSVVLGVQDGSSGKEISVAPVEVCDVAVKLGTSSALNAYALDKSITMLAGLMRAADDDAVQAVLAHELAHVALKHPGKYKRNAVVSGGILYGPPLYLGGRLLDMGLKAAGSKKKVSLANKALATAIPYGDAFEAEADYVGLYMLARAGGNIEEGGAIFRLFANESPGSTWLKYTHPLTPERVEAARLTAEEINAKREAGLPLLPETRD